MPWDWSFVGELVVGIGGGVGVGGAIFADRMEKAMLRVAGHPTVRKLANAADKFTGDNVGGWAGLIGRGLNFLTGGRFLQGGGVGGGTVGPGGRQKILVANEKGEIIGEAEAVVS